MIYESTGHLVRGVGDFSCFERCLSLQNAWTVVILLPGVPISVAGV